MATAQTVTRPEGREAARHAPPRRNRSARIRRSLQRRARTGLQIARTEWWPVVLLAVRICLGAVRTGWRTRSQWWPAVLLAARTCQGAVRTTWRTRSQWWPALLLAVRAGLREFRAAWLARITASPALLLALVVLAVTSWVARTTDLIAAPTPPAAAEAAPAPQAPPAPEPAPAPPAAPAAPGAPSCPLVAPAPPPPPSLTAEQVANARAIAAVAHERGLPERAVVIALATAQQESKLVDLNYGDLDSLGLFQQRPSMGWGTPEQVMDPRYAAGKFYDVLVQVPDWQVGRLTDVAQAVQQSGYPELYQQWEGLATALAASVAPAPPAPPACP